MLKSLIVSLCLSSAVAVPGGYLNAGYGTAGYGAVGLGLAGGLGLGLNGGLGLGGHGLATGLATGYGHGPLPAAIHSRRSYDVVHVPTYSEPAQLTQIDVDPIESPVAVRFVSKSSPVLIDQVHLPGEPGKHIETHSEDEPHRLIHTVSRPVIQEVREIIQPYRRIEQEIKPVLEEVNTVVAKGAPRIQSVVDPAPVAAPVAVVADAGLAHDADLVSPALAGGIVGGVTGGHLGLAAGVGLKSYSKLGYSK